MNRLTTFLAALLLAAPVSAQQALYRETDEGWFIYREAESCVAYVDFGNGAQAVTFRLSNRPDVGRLFFTAYGSLFERFREGIGESIMLGLGFESSREFLSSIGMILRNTEGSMGVTTSEFDVEELFRLMMSKRNVLIRVMPNAAPSRNARIVGSTIDFGPFPLEDGNIAMMHLQECTARYFSGRR